jgi:hypothetical protein
MEKTLIFIMQSKTVCKNIWKSCVDQHDFFKIKTVYEEPAKLNTALLKSNRNR